MRNPAYDSKTALGTVEAKVRMVVESMEADVDYMFCNWAQANVELDQIHKPTVIYVLPPAGDFDFSWREVKDYPDAQIAFVCSTEFDFESEQNDALVERMKRLAVQFVNALNESGIFTRIEGKLHYEVLYDHLDENVTGVVIEPPLEEEEGIIICDENGRLTFQTLQQG